MTKPVDLVVANIMHEAAAIDGIREFVTEYKGGKKTVTRKTWLSFSDAIARKLLCEISHDCPIEDVLTALEAVKAPASQADILEGLQAVFDRKKRVRAK